MSKTVKYRLTGALQTDGDFSVRYDGYGSELIKQYITHDPDIDTDWWFICMETEDPYEVRDFLQALMVNFKVGTHYWLVKSLYEFVEVILDKIFEYIIEENLDDGSSYVYNTYGGNDDGTNLLLEKIVDEDEEKEKV